MKLLVALFILIIISGCTRPPHPDFAQPTVKAQSNLEIAWIDPEIVASDSLLTLIRSERIDSFTVDKIPATNPAKKTDLIFQIERNNCFTMIRLIDTEGEIRYILLEETLPKGYYKLSVNLVKINDPFLFIKDTFIKADFCGATVVKPLGY